MDRDSITRTGARAPGVERQSPFARWCSSAQRPPAQYGVYDAASGEHEGRKQTGGRGRFAFHGKAPSDMPALKPYWGKPAVRNFRGGGGNVGIIRSPLPRHHLTRPTHRGPESCEVAREGSVEALTGVRAGRVLSRESEGRLRDADAVEISARHHRTHRYREMPPGPARSQTPCTYGNTSHENREALGSPAADGAAGRVGKSKDVRRR
jgi:hypothetical protein